MKPASPPAWSAWQPLGLRLSAAVLAETLDGGQSFRWSCDDAGVWTGIWSEHIAQLTLDPQGELLGRMPCGSPGGMAPLRHYLRLDTDFAALADQLPWRSDPHLAACLAAFPGLRLPRQPFGETLLCFLCSATKQIVQIKQMVALLAQNHGAQITFEGEHAGPSARQAHRHRDEPGHPPNQAVTGRGNSLPAIHRLPTWPELAAIPEDDLRRCLLGFRARYIKQTALFLAARPGWLDETEALPYPAAKARLMELPGVGEKVADCVLLFGAGKLEAFPVDTWILKALAQRYGLSGWKPAQLAQFGRAHYGPFAGLAQQFLFAYERRSSAATMSLNR